MKRIALAILALALAAWPAHAQDRREAVAAVPRTISPPCLPLDLRAECKSQGSVSPTGNPAKDLQALWQKIITASTADLQYASALAGAANTPGSAVRKQCWDAIIKINEQGQGLKDANGNVLTRPDPAVFADVESLAEVVDNLSPQGALFTSCAGAAQLARTSVLQFVSAVVTGVAGFTAIAPIIP